MRPSKTKSTTRPKKQTTCPEQDPGYQVALATPRVECDPSELLLFQSRKNKRYWSTKAVVVELVQCGIEVAHPSFKLLIGHRSRGLSGNFGLTPGGMKAILCTP